MSNTTQDLLPPIGPPPFLSDEQLIHLAEQGWLKINLPDYIQRHITEVFDQLPTFFNRTLDDKRNLYPSTNGTENGYYRVAEEKEYITFRNAVQPHLAVEQKAAQVWKDSGMLLHRILCDIARATDLPFTIWDEILHGTLTLPPDEDSRTATLARLFRYEPGSGIAERHADLGLLTLCVGNGQGLQMFDRSSSYEKWVDADGPVILVGRSLQFLSNHTMNTGIHQVVSNPEGRNSIVFALRNTYKGKINLEPFGGQGDVDAKEFTRKMHEGLVNINATKDIRSKQRDQQRIRAELMRQPQKMQGMG